MSCCCCCHPGQIPGIGKVTEQMLQALGVLTCSDLIRHAALLTALLSDISSSSLMEAGLGLGSTEHSSRGGGPGSSEPGRKGISCERTFGAMSSPAEMEQMVSWPCSLWSARGVFSAAALFVHTTTRQPTV